MTLQSRPIALTLSGGGIRAMAFHLGVLRFMSEASLMERVRRISTVSGGSLLVGLIYAANKLKWPTSQQFLSSVYPNVAEQLWSRSLIVGTILQLLQPRNWQYILSRANLLALELRRNWGLDVPLSAIGPLPEWSINGTTAENGKRFRFKNSEIGDWELGYAQAPDFPLGNALAVSAAFPVGFGPFALPTSPLVWKKRPWGAPEGSEKTVTLEHERLHLYDGGVYDNLGLEPYFHSGTQTAKHKDDYIIVSDAGAPLPSGLDSGPLSPFRAKRILDIVSEQSRALRIRSFTNYVQSNSEAGALILIGTPINGPQCKEAAFAKTYPTSLMKLSSTDFRRLSNYGYAVASGVHNTFGLG